LQGQRIGYVRVSSFDQNPERQWRCQARVFTDASGKDTQRPELERLLAFAARRHRGGAQHGQAGTQPMTCAASSKG
jgi:DNA invertase Pin-like site-specific DNA recombinase